MLTNPSRSGSVHLSGPSIFLIDHPTRSVIADKEEQIQHPKLAKQEESPDSENGRKMEIAKCPILLNFVHKVTFLSNTGGNRTESFVKIHV